MAKQFVDAKKTILHAYSCFVGVCKYASLKNKYLGFMWNKIFRSSLIDDIGLNEETIKSLKNSDDWKNVYQSLSLKRPFLDFRNANSFEKLMVALEKNGKHYEVPKLETCRELCEDLSKALGTFNAWCKNALLDLSKIVLEKNKFLNDEKRKKVVADKAKSDHLDRTLVDEWAKRKLAENGDRKSLIYSNKLAIPHKP